MKWKRPDWKTRMWIFLLIVFGISIIVAALWLFPDKGVGPNVMTAFLGMFLSGVVTVILLRDNSEKEAERNKDIKIFEIKVNTYADFVSKIWNTMKDNDITEEERIAIRTELFNKLIFYLNDKQINGIENALNEWKSNEFSNESALATFGKISSILRDDLYTSEESSENSKKAVLNTLWNSFSPQEPIEELNCENPPQKSTSLSEIRDIKEECYHFNIGDKVTQYKIFANGVSALVLWEYNENWRTERLKAVVHDSLIFLYLPGGAGYVGVFRAKGWICFESNGDGFIRNITASDKDFQVKDEELCVNEFISDGATSVAYLMVEPLIFYEKGVGRISVYRYTISSYYKGYARSTLSRFSYVLNENEKEIGKIAPTEDYKPLDNSEEFTKAQQRRLPRLERYRKRYDALKDEFKDNPKRLEEEQKKWSEKIKKLEGKIGAEAMKKAADYKTRPITLECNINEFTNILNRYDIHPSKIVNGEWEE